MTSSSHDQDIHPQVLELLVCPVTKGPLTYHQQELISQAARLAYPVRDGIPVLLPEEARQLDQEDLPESAL